jgi:hypothetical protein
MSENATSIFELDAPKRSLSFLNILNKPERIKEKKRRVALNRYMVRNLNVLSRSCHRIPRSRRCRSIRNVLKVEVKTNNENKIYVIKIELNMIEYNY